MVLLTLMVVGIAYAATVNIDSFNDGTQALWVDGSTTTASSVIDTSAALGGERDIYLQTLEGTTAQIQVNTDYGGTSDRFAYTAGDGMRGRATVTWDGDDNSAPDLVYQGLNNVNLVSSNPANDVILARIINADLRSRLTLQVYADTAGPNWSRSTISLPPLNPGTRMDVLFPFAGFTTGGGSGADFANVGAVIMILEHPLDLSVDVSIDFIEASNVREFGDLPVGTYGTTMLNANHIPQGLRLGPNCDAEATYNSSLYADGDDLNQANPDDEDGVVQTTLPWVAGANGGEVTMSPLGCANLGNCYVNGWIDWNGDGDFNDTVNGASERIIINVNRTTDAEFSRSFTVPDPLPTGNYFARFRICRTNTACNDPTYYNVIDGEVEDYRWYVGPTAVELGSFNATPQAWTGTIRLDWETLTEVNNLGFNLYRAESPTGRQIKLNADLIPSQGPGSPIGYTYSFMDRAVRAGRTYYYWLEAVDVYGSAQLFGPKSAAIQQLSAPRLSTP